MSLKTTVKVLRYDPGRDREPYFTDYPIEYQKSTTVLDALRWVKDNADGSLTIRYSCRSAICGSCAMRINGFSKLACKTMVDDELRRHGHVVVEPMANMQVSRDLIVDMTPFWGHMRRIEPWLIVDPQKPLPEREYLMTKAEARSFLGTPSCILCAACHSACPAVEVDADFPGPAALARLYRFAVDVRDDARKNRLEKIADTGLWWCVRCYLCVEACPKDVRPGEVITHLRELAAKETMVVEYGVKHAVAFRDNIRLYGNLNEFKLTKDTLGTLGLLKQLPRGVKMMLRGKTEAVKPFMKPIAHIEQVQEIYEEFGGKE